MNAPNLIDLEKMPRNRSELVGILQDHPYSSFDFIRRRFPTLSPKTVHYHLLKLIELGYVIKHGSTRGALYSAIGVII